MKFKLTLYTGYCKTEAQYIVEGENEDQLSDEYGDLFDDMAYNNFEQYDLTKEVASGMGLEPDDNGDYTEEQWEEIDEELKCNPPYGWCLNKATEDDIEYYSNYNLK